VSFDVQELNDFQLAASLVEKNDLVSEEIYAEAETPDPPLLEVYSKGRSLSYEGREGAFERLFDGMCTGRAGGHHTGWRSGRGVGGSSG
jgi:hypothetical protein